MSYSHYRITSCTLPIYVCRQVIVLVHVLMHGNVDGHQHSIEAFYGWYLDLIATLPFNRVLICHAICTCTAQFARVCLTSSILAGSRVIVLLAWCWLMEQ
jgi:hypothetical protein